MVQIQVSVVAEDPATSNGARSEGQSEAGAVQLAFAACDVSGAGALSEAEVVFALAALGLRPSAEELQEAIGSLTLSMPLGVGCFSTLVSHLRKTVCVEPANPALPFSRRGMSAGQLAALGAAYLDSGWLQEQCDAANVADAAAIAREEALERRADLYALDRFVVCPLTAADEAARGAVPLALRRVGGVPDAAPARACSYAQLANPEGVAVDFFVSHSWAHLLKRTLQTLTHYAELIRGSVGKTCADEVTFWICLFALNQHCKAEEVGASPEQGPFNVAVRQALHGTIMVVDRDVAPFARIWCLYEVQRTVELRKDFELVTEFGPLSRSDLSGQEEGVATCLRQVGEALAGVSALQAHASHAEDKHAIRYRIANAFVRDMFTYQRFKGMQPKPAWFEDFDVRVSSFLAQPLFQGALRCGDASAALRYLGYGAACGAPELAAVEGCGGNLRTAVRTRFARSCSLAHVMAYFGAEECLSYLLRCGLSVNAKDDRNFTPLHWAARCGREEAAALLLESSADPKASDRNGCTPLHRASYAGHAGTAAQIIGSKASINARDADQWTPLHCAVSRGHCAVVSLLLESEADAGLRVEVLRLVGAAGGTARAKEMPAIAALLQGGQ